MLTTQPNKEFYLQCVSLFGCEHLQCECCQIDEVVFLISSCFFLFAVRFFICLCCEHL